MGSNNAEYFTYINQLHKSSLLFKLFLDDLGVKGCFDSDGIFLSLLKFFEKIISNAASEIEMFDKSFEPQLRIADERFGDFQSNGVLPYSKRNGLNPRELAQTLVEKIPDNELWEISIAGPGL